MNTAAHCPNCGKALPAGVLKGLCQECLLQAAFASGTEPDPSKHGNPKGATFVPPSPQELSASFPQLDILELIGRGGMGAVYKVRQKQLDRIVALKILPPGIGGDAAFRERFMREARALGRLNHPGIVTLYEFGEANGLFFFLMEFVDGVNLRQLLQTRRVEPREALSIVPQICDALQYAHDQGIVHRDIKPENILLDRRGRVKVADFGLAKLIGLEAEIAAGEASGGQSGGLTDSGKVMGTPQYMAPEQMERPLEVDHRADIYALGVVLYQLLTGELPGQRIEPPSKKVQVDVRMDEIVLRSLEKNPERRYQQASTLKTHIENLSAPSPGEAASSQPYPIRFTSESVKWQYRVLVITWWIGFAFSIPAEFAPPLWVVGFPVLAIAVTFWCILLYRHWALLQGHGARTTPGKAVGFGFIPFYCFYWWFVAYAGLAEDNNRYLQRIGVSSARLSYPLAVANAILGIMYCTIGLIPVFGVLVGVPYAIIGYMLFRQQRECVLVLLEHRRREEQATGTTGATADAPVTA